MKPSKNQTSVRHILLSSLSKASGTVMVTAGVRKANAPRLTYFGNVRNAVMVNGYIREAFARPAIHACSHSQTREWSLLCRGCDKINSNASDSRDMNKMTRA